MNNEQGLEPFGFKTGFRLNMQCYTAVQSYAGMFRTVREFAPINATAIEPLHRNKSQNKTECV